MIVQQNKFVVVLLKEETHNSMVEKLSLILENG